MVYQDDEMIMISSLQHYLFCPRQCALIHLEQVWEENYLTASGKLMHERVDSKENSTRHNIHYATGLRLFSRKIGLVGIADMVEFHQVDHSYDENGKNIAVTLKKLPLFWKPFPVEYKRGTSKTDEVDQIQLCAQAICIEEMLNVEISSGALFYGQTRHREQVDFTPALRNKVIEISEKIHIMFQNKITPLPQFKRSCQACSLKDICMPEQYQRSAGAWLQTQISEALI